MGAGAKRPLEESDQAQEGKRQHFDLHEAGGGEEHPDDLDCHLCAKLVQAGRKKVCVCGVCASFMRYRAAPLGGSQEGPMCRAWAPCYSVAGWSSGWPRVHSAPQG